MILYSNEEENKLTILCQFVFLAKNTKTELRILT